MTTTTHIAYLHLCHRKLWLFANGMQMEHRSELVAEGRFIDETSYPQRAERWQADLRNLKDFVNLASPSAKPPSPPPAKRNREQAPEVTNVHWQRHKSMAAREDMRIPLAPEHGYHIFNRGNGGHRTFFSDENYRYFLMKYAQYMKDYWDTYAYCLLPNHFHLAVRVKPVPVVLAAGIRDLETVDRKLVSRLEKDLPNLGDLVNLNTDALADLRNLEDFVNLASRHEALRTYLASWLVSERFRRFLLGYAKAVNKERGRTGSLFQKIFRRRLVADDDSFQTLLMYIHRNPLHHHVALDWEAYPWSSYRSYLSELPSALPRVEVLSRFGGGQAFVNTHREYADDWEFIQRYLME